MIVTLTANPALDRTIALEAPLVPGDVQQALSAREDAGGKGINVARAVASAGVPTLAVLPLSEDDPYGPILRATGLPTRTVAVHGHVRANIALTDAAGTTTKINLPGVELDPGERRALIAAVVEASRDGSWTVLAGSLPLGPGDDFYVDVARAIRGELGDAAPRIAVDTSGPALRAVVDAGIADLVKPNDDELAELAGVTLEDVGGRLADIVRIARSFVPSRVAAALITLGGDGAVLVTADDAFHAAPPPIRVRSTVGAGDSSLAGYLLADLADATPAERLRHAVRYGSAAAALPGTQIPTPHDLPAGEVVLTPLALSGV
ncbi:1-phosphofructokinase [Microbacterium limosum]|uniref:1-phosphofructokinase n=1 Tax=Microbacterium limosum TaxID=3079935 RepID=A0AAU0MEI0_9MICO|nr:1-phosphofructokinase [Microbacterium sp. Y20]WOQ68544.1 1-phosphofructokinase [Microbacterium sp. Y20]